MSMPSQDPRDLHHLTLDPSEWDGFRSLAHQAVDDMVDQLIALREQPVWQSVPDSVRRHLSDETLPLSGQGEESVYREFLENVFPYRNGNLHPRFFGWVQGGGIPLANLADFLASVMNPHLAGCDQSPVLVEAKVIAWVAEMMGFPKDCSGVLESGGTMANILGLAVARNTLTQSRSRTSGVQGSTRGMTIYCSSETHGWIQKGVELLGIGTDWLRLIPVDENYQIKPRELQQAIQQDRNAGHLPICVVGSAGTVNTGAIDDLDAVADICEKEKLWFHVDGAFGAMANLSPRIRPQLKGMNRADSIAVDLHKWMYLPFEIACILVRDGRAHTETFAFAPSYIAELKRGVIAGGLPFSDRGVDLTRGFKALKAWMCLKAYGVESFQKVLEQNLDQTQYLKSIIESEPGLELLAPVPLNVVCFRFNPGELTEDELNPLNLEILLRVQESGVAVPSSTVLSGRFAIRYCNVNHRTKFEDIRWLADKVLEIGHSIRP